MNHHKTLSGSYYAVGLLFAAMLCFISACQFFGDDNEKPDQWRYKADTVILIQFEHHSYLARVTADIKADAEEVPVHVFSEDVREQIGDTIAIKNVVTTRKAPNEGWGTRVVALEYFDGDTWKYETNVREFEDNYLLPEGVTGTRLVEFSQVRFIPVVPIE